MVEQWYLNVFILFYYRKTRRFPHGRWMYHADMSWFICYKVTVFFPSFLCNLKRGGRWTRHYLSVPGHTSVLLQNRKYKTLKGLLCFLGAAQTGITTTWTASRRPGLRVRAVSIHSLVLKTFASIWRFYSKMFPVLFTFLCRRHRPHPRHLCWCCHWRKSYLDHVWAEKMPPNLCSVLPTNSLT